MHNFYKYLIGMLIACFCWQTSFANDETLPSGKNKSQPKEQPSTGVSAEVSAENIVGKKASLEAQIELEKAMQSLNLQNVSAQKVVQKDFMMDVSERLSMATVDNRSQARGVFQYLDSKNLYKEGDLQYDDLMTLPIGLKKSFNNSNATAEVGVLKANFFADYAEITIFVRLKINVPNSGSGSTEKEIFFGADKVKVSKAGGVQAFKAILLGDFIVPMGSWTLKLKGGLDITTGNIIPNNATYCQVECGQFKEAMIDAELIFPRNVLVPLDPTTYEPTTDQTDRVTGRFKVKCENGLNSIIAKADIDKPFAAASFDKLGFILKEVVIDMSDTSNDGIPSGLVTGQEDLGGNANYWKGIYAAQFSILLPKEFKDKEVNHASGRKAITIQNFLLGKSGVSGTFSFEGTAGSPAISLANGDASSWSFSLYRFSVTLDRNKLVQGNFQGQLKLPLAPDTPFEYDGSFKADGNYQLTVKTNSSYTLKFKPWRATATVINPEITLAVVNGAFKPTARLNGKMTIGTNLSGTSDLSNSDDALLRLADIEFQNLVLKTDAPYISLDAVKITNNQKLAGFMVSVDNLGVAKIDDERFGLDVGLGVSLMANKLSGSAGAQFVMRYRKEGGAEWELEALKFQKISVAGSIGKAVELSGMAEVYETSQKKGFKGQIMAQVTGGSLKVKGAACAEFGFQKEQNYHYWNVQLAAQFSPSLPLVAPFAINGASIGVYHHMKAQSTSGGNSSLCSLGSENVEYKEDKSIELGVKGVLGLEAGSSFAFKGFAGLEMVFGTQYGLQSVALFGEGKILGDFIIPSNLGYMSKQYATILDKETSLSAEELAASRAGNITEDMLKNKAKNQFGDKNDNGPIYARIGILLNLKPGEEYFKANANVTVNVANFITGSGDMELFIGHNPTKVGLPNEWWVYVGTPQKRLSIDVDAIAIKSKATAYFMLGYNIPDLPCPSDGIVREMFKDKLVCDSQGFYKRTCDTQNKIDFAAGTGLAMGMNAQIEAGFNLGLYGKVRGELGFDINVKEYSNQNFCGRGYGVNDLGISRWYAMGQVYAGVEVEVGIDALLGKIELASGRGAVLLQMGMPNPVWGRGLLHLSLSLGGVVDISTTPEISFGNVCPEITGINNCN